MNVAEAKRKRLLQWEMTAIQHLLDQFEPPPDDDREAFINTTGDYVVIKNFPLPDWCLPADSANLVLLIEDFPQRPPIGLYMMRQEKPSNSEVIRKIQQVFNVLGTGYHGAKTIEGYHWICVHYANNQWHYNADAPHKGDNLAKFLLGGFYGRLQERSM